MDEEKKKDSHYSDKVQLKDDGNVTKQIYDAIGFETLQSYYDVYQKSDHSENQGSLQSGLESKNK